MTRPPQRRTWILICAIGGCLLAMAVAAIWTYGSVKKETIVVGNQNWKGKYTGLGLTGSETFWGYRFTEYTVTGPEEVHTVTKIDNSDVWRCEARSKSGRLLARGTIPVEGSGIDRWPEVGYWIDAVSYGVDGKENGRIVNGNGTLSIVDDAGNGTTVRSLGGIPRIR